MVLATLPDESSDSFSHSKFRISTTDRLGAPAHLPEEVVPIGASTTSIGGGTIASDSGRRPARLSSLDLSTLPACRSTTANVDMLHEPAADEPLGIPCTMPSIEHGLESGCMDPVRRVFIGSATSLSIQCDAVSAVQATYAPSTRVVFLE